MDFTLKELEILRYALTDFKSKSGNGYYVKNLLIKIEKECMRKYDKEQSLNSRV